MKEILATFGARLKALRKERKMTQEEVAKKLGLHNSYIGLLERGERIPSLITLERVASYFGIKTSDLIVEEQKRQKLSLKQKEMLYIINEGSEESIDKIYKVARIVMEKRLGRKK